MGTGFAHIPGGESYRLTNVRTPLCLVTAGGLGGDQDGLSLIDITVEEGRIASVVPAGTFTLDNDVPAVDLAGGIVLPRFVDIHTHLDKGFIWARGPNPDGTFVGAIEATAADREANWSAEDVRARMEFGLRCALAHGTGAIRTHIDSIDGQTGISWPVFAALREEWRDHILLQGVSLFPIDLALSDPAQFQMIVETTAQHGGILGGVTFLGQAPDESTEAALDRVVAAAQEHGLDLDLHVDESGAPEARTLTRLTDTILMRDFPAKVLVGHCCSLGTMGDEELEQAILGLLRARASVVSLPMCNMYLQDRQLGRTPRWRGVAPLHELKRAGVPVMVASDNTRDPFYAYGDLDMLEVFREATRILQLDHAGGDWIRAVTATPADIMGLDRHGRIEAGDRADLVLTRARSYGELLSRPHEDRTVLVAGRPIDTTRPDYRELDHFMKGRP
jgi:cytosine deaminase